MNDPSSFALSVHGKTLHKGRFHLKHWLESHKHVTVREYMASINQTSIITTKSAMSVLKAHYNTVTYYLYLQQQYILQNIPIRNFMPYCM
jgi:hypothetical protein